MKFFDALRRSLGQDAGTPVSPSSEEARRLNEAWGLDPAPARSEGFADASLYDQAQWRKKLKLILDTLPESSDRWDELIAESRAMNFNPDWVAQCQVEEFLLLIRRAVSDRRFTEEEHQKLDLARQLIGIPEVEAEAALLTVIAEAEQFFGKPVREV
ncbi:MAG: hypothetical protein P4L84_20685 [Isosphaeraceae bacterium]|nr:hypothetical protein [Isosphaeraceae bacterium]